MRWKSKPGQKQTSDSLFELQSGGGCAASPMKVKVELLALVLGCLGLSGLVLATLLPMWRQTFSFGVVLGEATEGLWMYSSGHVGTRRQFQVYGSNMVLPVELQAARGLMCVSIVLVVVALPVTGCGTYNTRCKNSTLAAGGGLFLLSFLTTLVPVCWVAHTISVRRPSLKSELGESLFIGWATSGVLLLTGGVLLLCYWRHRSKEGEEKPDFHLLDSRGLQELGSGKHLT